MYILNKNLQLLKARPRVWNNDIFSNLQRNVKDNNDKIVQIQIPVQNYGVIGNLLLKEIMLKWS